MGVTFLAAVEPGGYISIFKAIPVVLVLLLWTRLLTWVDKDAPAAHLPRESINLGLLGGLILAFALFFLLPVGFLIAFPILVLVMLIEAGAYLAVRHRKVGLGDLQEQFNEWIRSFTQREKKIVETPNTVQLITKSGPIPPPPAEDPARPAYEAMQAALAEPLRKGAEQIDVTPGADGVSVKYYVDGYGYRGATVERANGAGAISLVKAAAGLDVEQKRKPQRGMIKAVIDGRRHELRVDTAGSTAGEYLRLGTDFKKRYDFSLDTLGLTEPQAKTIRGLVKEKPGVVLISAPKSQGLTTLLYAVVRAHDAFLEHIHTVERAPDLELDGITQNKLPANATGADEAKQTSWVISQEPDVILISRIESQKTARDLIAFAREKRVYVGLQAGSTFEALEQWRKLVGDDKTASSELRLIINGRIVRKLCLACKIGYVPDPATLRKLNMDPNKVKELYQARTEPLRDPKGNPIPCDFCNDLRFKGRVGVFETFAIDDEARAVISAGAQPSQVKAVFRKQRGRYLQEEALSLVEAGETSVQEVLRVLKGGDTGAGGAPPAAAEARSGPPPIPSARATARPTKK